MQQEDPDVVEGDDGEEDIGGVDPVGEDLLKKYYMVSVVCVIVACESL